MTNPSVRVTLGTGHRRSPSLAPLFQTGQLLATPGALRTMEGFGVDPIKLLTRHVSGDWGDLDDDDANSNELALLHGSRIFSAYEVSRTIGTVTEKATVWLITEALPRSCSTFLLPKEY